MKRIEKINPNNVISVTEIPTEQREDKFIYICTTTTEETFLMPYNPLEKIKQFIKYGYAVVKDSYDNFRTEKIKVFINFYGNEATEFLKSSSPGEIVIVCDSVFQATNYIHKHSLDKFCA